jgi:hypothetical protein
MGFTGQAVLIGCAVLAPLISPLDAVRQWIFEPTMLNGVAVEVAAPITVNFILN